MAYGKIKADAIIYDDSGSDVEKTIAVLASAAPTASPTFTGDVTLTGAANNVVFDASDNALEFADNAKATFGAAADLELYHNGTDSYIQNNTGNIRLEPKPGELGIVVIPDGNVSLYYDAVKKFETTAAGVTVTGSVTDDKGELRTIPQLSKSSKHTIVLADAGKHSINSSGGWEFDTSTAFTAGMAITLINNSGSDQTVEADGVTLYNTADAATGNRTLAGRGMATVICTASNTYYISGAGLS